MTLLEEVALHFGLPRKIISDNGAQITCAVMQQLCYLSNIDWSLSPVYQRQSNPVERKKRFETSFSNTYGNGNEAWKDKLSLIIFALNIAKCHSTGQSAAFLQFKRELKTLDDVRHDIKSVIENDIFLEITPYLKRFARSVQQVRERVELHQNKQKPYADKKRQ